MNKNLELIIDEIKRTKEIIDNMEGISLIDDQGITLFSILDDDIDEDIFEQLSGEINLSIEQILNIALLDQTDAQPFITFEFGEKCVIFSNLSNRFKIIAQASSSLTQGIAICGIKLLTVRLNGILQEGSNSTDE